MNNYSGHLGYNQPYPPASGQFPSTGPGYPPAGPTYPSPHQQPPPIGFVPPPAAPGPMYPQNPYPAGPAAAHPYPASMPLPYPVHPTAPLTQPAAPAFGAYPGHGAPGPTTQVSYPPAIPPHPDSTFRPSYPADQPQPAPLPAAAGGSHHAPGYPASAMTYDHGFQAQGTVKSNAAFNAEQDCQLLRKAMKGLGTDKQTIVNVLGTRSNEQRQQLKLTYKTLFGRDLVKDLSSELSFRFKQTVLALMMTPVEYDAEQLNKAIRGAGTDEEAIVEILCTRTNQQIRDVRTAYRNSYRNELERDLVGDTSGHFRRFVVSLVTAGRPEGNAVNHERAKRDAVDLFEAGEKKRWGTDQSKFNEILCCNSYAQLRAVFSEYQKLANRTIQLSLGREMSGDLLMGMQTLANVITNPHKYFADRLHRSMKGLGTNDDTLIRVIISRSEIDLLQIKQEFQRQYGRPLESWIQGDTSGDYREILLLLVRGN